MTARRPRISPAGGIHPRASFGTEMGLEACRESCGIGSCRNRDIRPGNMIELIYNKYKEYIKLKTTRFISVDIATLGVT